MPVRIGTADPGTGRTMGRTRLDMSTLLFAHTNRVPNYQACMHASSVSSVPVLVTDTRVRIHACPPLRCEHASSVLGCSSAVCSRSHVTLTHPKRCPPPRSHPQRPMPPDQMGHTAPAPGSTHQTLDPCPLLRAHITTPCGHVSQRLPTDPATAHLAATSHLTTSAFI